MQNKRKIGSVYESRAAEYLRQRGYIILEQNYGTRTGEIDLIARGEGYMCFVEVKYRADASRGVPEEAVDKRKQRHICRTAQYYLMKNGCGEDTPCRFDVIAIEGEVIRHIPNAFEFI